MKSRGEDGNDTALTAMDAKLILLERSAMRCVNKGIEFTTLNPLNVMRSSGDTSPSFKRGRLRKRPVINDPLIDAAGNRASE